MTSATRTTMNDLARYLAGRISGHDLIDGTFLRVAATAESDGYIAVTVTRVNFTSDSSAMRFLLHITEPMSAANAEDESTENVNGG